MVGLVNRYSACLVAFVFIASVSSSIGSSASAAVTYRSGNPPVIISAVINSQRQLEVVYKADDGLTFGGTIYLDNNPLNGEPPLYVDTKYGNFMYCNNKSNCLGRWSLPVTPEVGPFTFRSEPLDPVRFPTGTYYLQVETHNEDPYPSTRMWELSPVSVVQLGATSNKAVRKDESAPKVVLVPQTAVTRVGKKITAKFKVTDDSKQAKVVAALYSNGTLVQKLEDAELSAATGKQVKREFTAITGGSANGPFYVCVWAVDAAGNESAKAPYSACQWRSIEVAINWLSNGCGSADWGATGDMAQNLFLNTREYDDITVNVAPACDLHDAGYAGATVYDSINLKLIDFRTWSRAEVDLKFRNDIRKICRALLKQPAALKQCTNGAPFSISGASGIFTNNPPGANTYYEGVRAFGKNGFDTDSTTPGTQNVKPGKTTPEGGARSNGS